jgi:EpsI family protein
MIARAAALAALLLLTGAYTRYAGSTEQAIARRPLSELPREIAGWTVTAEPPLDRQTLEVLRVDDYANRWYARAQGEPVALYVGYYASQRQGDSVHSPQNCLPGAGWQPVSSRARMIETAGLRAPVNEYVIQKGLDRQVVLYWYQGRGRIIANEYANKFWLMVDAARLHRSNGSLVRIIAPAASAEDVSRAGDTAAQFAVRILPTLRSYLP